MSEPEPTEMCANCGCPIIEVATLHGPAPFVYWIGFCECGWRSKNRQTLPAAEYDARRHYAESRRVPEEERA